MGRGRSVDGYTVSRLSAERVVVGRGRVTGSPRLYKQCILTSAPHTEQLPHRTALHRKQVCLWSTATLSLRSTLMKTFPKPYSTIKDG